MQQNECDCWISLCKKYGNAGLTCFDPNLDCGLKLTLYTCASLTTETYKSDFDELRSTNTAIDHIPFFNWFDPEISVLHPRTTKRLYQSLMIQNLSTLEFQHTTIFHINIPKPDCNLIHLDLLILLVSLCS